MKLIPKIGLLSLFFVACSTKNEQQQANTAPMAVGVYEAKAEDIPLKIDIPGSVLPAETVDVYSEVSGRVKKIYFEEGKKVQKGELLIQVDVDILQAQKAKLMVDLDLAQKDKNRKEKLFNVKGISEEELEKSIANLEAIKAQIQLIDVQISKAQIRAPFSGKIGLRQISEGAYITPQILITTIIQDEEIKIEFAIAEKYANRVKIGQKIVFTLHNDSQQFSGKIYAFQPFINADSRMLTLRAKLKNNANIVPGSFVSVNYDLGVEKNAFLIPAECVVPELNGQKIWLMQNGKAHELNVMLGIRTADKIQVNGQIKAGDKILTTGLLAVKEGMPIQIKK
jgi:membrane fusion protein (multidrug efflux system)